MESEPSYQKTLDYLYSFIDYSLTKSFRYTPDKFDLRRMFDFVAHLGEPQGSYPIIHVAGTKGKGSVAAMCASALQAAGYRVGLYTSPHLEDYAERIQVDGKPIPHANLVALVDEIRPYLEEHKQLTTFEITTALAFLYFARQGASAVVAEVGLGGRLDATNVVAPLVAVITSISYDHVEILGSTLGEIAGEKAGIIKPGVPVVVAPQEAEAQAVIERIAAEREAPLILVGRDYPFAPWREEETPPSLESQRLVVWRAAGQPLAGAYGKTAEAQDWSPAYLNIPLLGGHQVINAATAYAALHVAQERGLIVSEEAIRRGFAEVYWPARFEVLRRQPPLVVDSAHNRDSALRLRQTLDDYFPSRPVILVFGASEDKDVEGMFAELMPRVRQVIATRSYHPRAMEPDRLEELARRYESPATIVPAVEEALEQALRLADDESMVLVTGSIFVAAGARQTWLERHAAQDKNSLKSKLASSPV
jgi:dihydrofolate synthase/folylpolyglutamate synthase